MSDTYVPSWIGRNLEHILESEAEDFEGTTRGERYWMGEYQLLAEWAVELRRRARSMGASV